MGQYYELINTSKRQISHTLGFAKMVEQLASRGNQPILALLLTEVGPALSESSEPSKFMGTWSGDRIVLIGDYSCDTPSFLTEAEGQEIEAAFNSYPTLYKFACETYTPVSPAKRTMLFEGLDTEMVEELFLNSSDAHHLVLNLDKKEYLDPQKSKSPATSPKEFANLEFGVMQGLYSLIFYSDGCGGGDLKQFRSGRWAGDHLTIREKDKVEDLDSWTDISEMVVESLREFY
ncbi:hypothetical protein BGX21_008322 [Mortierella sp. AD011]|nr:hypothetical protein BGX20_008398 [Mortierella sp. AD010]KAF9397963.1 hypothetical protein BGX21_008322 [Mortierella sp. AD011]